MRVIVTGGRDYKDYKHVESVLAKLPHGSLIMHGANPRGADMFAARAVFRTDNHLNLKPYPAQWDAPCQSTCKPGHRRISPDGHGDYCPAQGNYRNQRMADAGADLCIAFPGGTGTKDMVRRAVSAGILVMIEGGPDGSGTL